MSDLAATWIASGFCRSFRPVHDAASIGDSIRNYRGRSHLSLLRDSFPQPSTQFIGKVQHQGYMLQCFSRFGSIRRQDSHHALSIWYKVKS